MAEPTIGPLFDCRTDDSDPTSMTDDDDGQATERTGSSTTAGHRAPHKQADLQGEPTTSPRPPEVIGPLLDCAIVGCGRPAEWRVLGTDERIGLCRHHRDLIEDEGLDLIDDA